jgi:cell division protein FtsL
MKIKIRNFSIEFTKAETKNIVMMGFVVFVLVVVFNVLIIHPVAEQKASVRNDLAELQKKVDEAEGQIQATKKLEANAPSVAQQLKRIAGIVKPGKPISWVPPFLQDYFHRKGIEVGTVAYNGESPDPLMADYKRTLWLVEIPRVSFLKVGAVVAEMENTIPVLEVSKIDVSAEKGQGDTQTISVELALTLKDVPDVVAAAVAK